MYDLILFFSSYTQPKPSANISTDTEWQSNTAHWYAYEEALPKLIVSSAKAGSSDWSKQVGVKVLAWREDTGTTQCKEFFFNKAKWYISNGLNLSWVMNIFIIKLEVVLFQVVFERMTQF